MNRKLLLFWLLTGIALCVFLQVCYPYLFFFNEQSQLFLADSDFFLESLGQPGGLTLWLSAFCVQFFVYPYAGPCVAAAVLTWTAAILGSVVGRMTRSSVWAMAGWLPVLAQVWMLTDFNYTFQGTVSLWMAVGAMWLCMQLRQERIRLLAELVSGLALVWLAGPAALLFALWVLIYEAGTLSRRKWLAVCPLLAAVALSGGLWKVGIIPEARFAFLPDAYYHHLLKPGRVILYAWIGVCVLTGIAWLVRKKNWVFPTVRSRWIAAVVLCGLAVAYFYGGIMHWGNLKMRRYMMLDYYSRTGQWQKIEENCRGKLTNFLYMNLLARALAEKGELAEKMFEYDFKGELALAVNWNRTEDVSVLLSDIYFTAGNIALSQRLAFEGNSCARGNYNPRLLQRLVQTNLIYGEYAVAEKYIRLLEKSWTYRKWAGEQRKFLYNDEAVVNDRVLGSKRQLLLSAADTTQQKVAGEQIEPSMALPVLANPEKAVTAFQYLMGAYLLQKDLASFQYMIDHYSGTPLLPKLPVPYQEALIVAHEKNPEGLNKYKLDQEVISRYQDFRKQVLANRNNRGLAGLLYRSFGDTYWYYVIFK